jgi:DNA-binding beta-propeller fold protein YncE
MRKGIVTLGVLIGLAIALNGCASQAQAKKPTPGATATPVAQEPVTATPVPLSDHAIYVVDTRGGDPVSHILIVNPDIPRVERTFWARGTPDIAFSPDGRKLYVADSYLTQVIRGTERSALSVYDPLTGDLLHDDVSVPGRLLYKLFPMGVPNLFLSHNGRRIFAGKYGDPDIHNLRLSVLDADTLTPLAEYQRPECLGLWPLPDGRLVCAAPSSVRFINPLTGETSGAALLLPEMQPVATILAPAGDRLYLLESAGRVTIITLAGDAPQLAAQSVTLDHPSGAIVGANHLAVAPDGSRLYVGYLMGEGQNQGLAAEVWAYDAHTWAAVGQFHPADPAFHLAVSATGRQLYTVNPFARSLAVLDTATYREVGVLHDLGETPARVVVPPG